MPLSIVTLVPDASVTSPPDTNSRLFAVLVPVRFVAESSVIDTASFNVLNVNEPKFTVPVAPIVTAPDPPLNEAVPLTLRVSPVLSARLIDVPVIEALPLAIVTLVLAASVTAPLDESVRLSPVLAPVSSVDESSEIDTAPPVVLNVSEPKFTVPSEPIVIAPLPPSSTIVPLTLRVSAESLARVIPDPVIEAFPLETEMLAVPLSTTAPVAETDSPV